MIFVGIPWGFQPELPKDSVVIVKGLPSRSLKDCRNYQRTPVGILKDFRRNLLRIPVEIPKGYLESYRPVGIREGFRLETPKDSGRNPKRSESLNDSAQNPQWILVEILNHIFYTTIFEDFNKNE